MLPSKDACEEFRTAHTPSPSPTRRWSMLQGISFFLTVNCSFFSCLQCFFSISFLCHTPISIFTLSDLLCDLLQLSDCPCPFLYYLYFTFVLFYIFFSPLLSDSATSAQPVSIHINANNDPNSSTVATTVTSIRWAGLRCYVRIC